MALLRWLERVTRGPVGVAGTVVVFLAAGAVSSGVNARLGLALVSGWVLMFGGYCALNFWHCGETHCAVTGTGWTMLGLLGYAAVAAPGRALWWVRVDEVAAVFVAVLAAGYALEWVVAARTGQRSLRRRP